MKPRQITLTIDTTQMRVATVGLVVDGVTVGHETVRDSGSAQPLLPLIDRMLTKNGLTVRDVTGITVAPGPGSFTGVRVGIAVANALSVLLGIPVNGSSSLATPVYS